MAFLVLVVASLGMLSCSGVLPESTTPSAVVEQQVTLPQPVEEMRDLTIVEKAALADGLAAGLQNPGSVKFRWTKVPKALNAHSFGYCGLLVVKKASYCGSPVSSDDREEHRDIVPKLCGQKGLNPFDAK
jgi:hypothetical protein